MEKGAKKTFDGLEKIVRKEKNVKPNGGRQEPKT